MTGRFVSSLVTMALAAGLAGCSGTHDRPSKTKKRATDAPSSSASAEPSGSPDRALIPQCRPGDTVAVGRSGLDLVADIRVGTWVYASPIRPAWSTAWEAHSLSMLTEGRFELGIGTGRPGIDELTTSLGLPTLSTRDRLERVRGTVEELRKLDGPDHHTPVAMAVRGPKAREMAAELADIITFAITPDDARGDVVAMAHEVRARCCAELAVHVSVVGDTVAPFMAPPDTDPARLRAADSLAYLPGDPSAAIDEILRRRDEAGFTYVVVGANAAETLAPMVAELAR